MKYLAFILVGMFWNCLANAQANLSIDSIDHIYLESISFFKRDGKKFSVNKPNLKSLENNAKLDWTGFYSSTKREHIYSSYMNENNPLFIKPEDVLDMRNRESGKLFFPAKNSSKHWGLKKIIGENEYVLSVLNEHLLVVRKYRKPNPRVDGSLSREREWILDRIYPFLYYTIEVNGKTIIAIIDEQPSGFWDGGYIAETRNRMFVQVANLDFSDAEAVELSRAENMDYLSYESSDFEEALYFTKKQHNDKYVLKTYLGETLLQDCDSIYIQYHFILAEKDGKLDIHFPDLKTPPLRNIRAAYPLYGDKKPYYLQVLQGNEVKIVDITGNFVSKEKLIPEEIQYVCGTVPSWRFAIKGETVVNYDMGYGGGTPKDSTKVSLKDLKAEELRFVDGSDRVFMSANDYFRIGYVPKTLIRFKKKRKYGLLNVDFDNPNQPYQIILPAEFDELIFDQKEPLRLRKGDLYGWYPMQKEAKFKKLEDFDHNFSRFELSGGTKGWMDIHGNAYLDQ